MGLFSFLKKKQSDQPVAQSTDVSSLNTDLPSIDGSNMAMPELADPSASEDGPKSISFNVPTLDFSMPALDDQAQNVDSTVQPTGNPEELSADDLNRLFPSDDWREPDLTNFDPYPEERIEQPKPEDFGVTQVRSDLPSFEEGNSPIPSSTNDVKRTGPKPLQIYVRGKSYNKVFVEIERISQALQHQDSRLSNFEELVKREDSLMILAKEQTEYIYRKLNQVDKKIFAS